MAVAAAQLHTINISTDAVCVCVYAMCHDQQAELTRKAARMEGQNDRYMARITQHGTACDARTHLAGCKLALAATTRTFSIAVLV